MRKLLLLTIAVLTMGVAQAQQEIIPKELTKKELRELKRQKKEEKRIARLAARGLNQYGINETGQTWFNVLKDHLTTSRQSNGIPILRPAQSLSNGRTFPLWVINGQQYDFPPGDPLSMAPRIREVRILVSLTETNRFGQQGRAGVIILTIE